MLFDWLQLSIEKDNPIKISSRITILMSIFIPLKPKQELTGMLLVKSKIKKFLILTVLLFTMVTCEKESYNVIPNVPFTVVLSANEVVAIGAGTAVTEERGGYAGLIIYHPGGGEFQAFDRLCTNYPADTAVVTLDKSTLIATCPKCKSTFQISLQGQVTKGPAKYSLKQYRTSYDGTRLTISN
jgi:nitrite reductase/ring-hydroxylating ferredoxin subunit